MRIEDPNDPDPSRQAGAAFMDPFSEVDRSFRTTPTWTGARAIVYIYIYLYEILKKLYNVKIPAELLYFFSRKFYLLYYYCVLPIFENIIVLLMTFRC